MRSLLFLFVFCLPSLAQDLPTWAEDPMLMPSAKLWEATYNLGNEESQRTYEILCKVDIRIGADHRVTSRSLRVFRILDRYGLTKESVLKASWTPSFENQPKLRARVLNGPNKEELLTSQAIRAKEGCSFQVEAELPELRVGSLVVTEIVTSEHAPFEGGVSGCPKLFPALWLKVAIESPKDYSLHIRPEHLSAEPVEVLPEGNELRLFTAYQTPWHKDTQRYLSTSKNVVDHWPALQFSAAASWNSQAKYYHERVEALLTGNQPKPPTELKIDGDIGKTAFNIGQWAASRIHVECAEDGTFAPQNLSTTLETGKGRMVDRALFLIASFRALDIPAKLVFVDNQTAELDGTTPDVRRFNRYLVFVDGKHWLDPMAPSEFDPPFYFLYAQLLIIDPETQSLDSIIYRPTDDQHLVMAADEDLRQFGKRNERLRIMGLGEFNRLMREDFATKSMDQQLDAIRELAPNFLYARFTNINTPDDYFIITTIREESLLSNADMRISLFPFESFSRMLASTPEQILRLKPQEYLIHERLEYLLPPDYQVEQRLASESFNFGPLMVSAEYHYEQNRIVVWLNAGLRDAEATLEKIRTTISDLAQLKDKIVILPKVMARLERHEAKQVIADLKRQLSDPIVGAAARIQLAFVYERLGMGELAMELMADTNGEPALLLASIVLAEQKRPKGSWPRSQCIAAYRALLDLEAAPSNDLNNGLANALTYDTKGIRFAQGSDLERALEYFAVTNNKQEYLTVLAALGRFEEMLEQLNPAGDSERELEILARLGMGQVETVRSQLDGATPEQREGLLNRTVGLLMKTRQFALMESRIKQLRPYIEGEDDLVVKISSGPVDPTGPNTPKSLLQRWHRFIIDPASEPLEELWQPQLLKEAHPQIEAQRLHAETITRLFDLSIDMDDTIFPLYLASYTIEGSPEQGYRCRSTNFDTLYLAPANGKLYVVGTRALQGLLGRHILNLLEREEIETARRWLDWIQDDLANHNDNTLSDWWSESGDRQKSAITMAAHILLASVANGPSDLLNEAYKSASGQRRMNLALIISGAQNAKDQDTEMLLELVRYYPFWSGGYKRLIKHLRAVGKEDCMEDMRDLLAPYRERNFYDYTSALDDPKLLLKALEALEKEGLATDNHYNETIWRALFLEPLPEDVHQLGLKFNPGNYNRAHTLAVLEAKEGRFLEALSLLRGSESEANWVPRPLDWLVLGLIAEGSGETATARAYFAKIPPDTDDPFNSYVLAQRYLAQLDQEKKDPSASAPKL